MTACAAQCEHVVGAGAEIVPQTVQVVPVLVAAISKPKEQPVMLVESCMDLLRLLAKPNADKAVVQHVSAGMATWLSKVASVCHGFKCCSTLAM